MEIRIAEHFSKEHFGAVKLRKQVLGSKIDYKQEEKLIVFVAIENGEVVGTASVQLYRWQVARVRQVAVLPEYQGKSIGDQLMASCEAFAKAHNHPRLVLTARKVSSLFYLKRDYHIFLFSFKRQAIDFFWMTKRLDTLETIEA